MCPPAALSDDLALWLVTPDISTVVDLLHRAPVCLARKPGALGAALSTQRTSASHQSGHAVRWTVLGVDRSTRGGAAEVRPSRRNLLPDPHRTKLLVGIALMQRQHFRADIE